jgi:chromosome segregation ATPase
MSDTIQEIIGKVKAFNDFYSRQTGYKTEELVDLETMIAEVLKLRQQVAELEADRESYRKEIQTWYDKLEAADTQLSAYREALEHIDRHVLDDMTYPEGYRELREIARRSLTGDTKLYRMNSGEEDVMTRALAKSAKIVGDTK